MEKKILAAMKKAGKPVRPGDVAKMISEDSKAVLKSISELRNREKSFLPSAAFSSQLAYLSNFFTFANRRF